MKQFGFLFSWSGFGPEVPSGQEPPFDEFSKRLNEVPQFTDITDRHGVARPKDMPSSWRLLSFRSLKPLAGEDLENSKRLDSGDFPYHVYVRINAQAGTIIFAARRYSITEAAVMTFHTYTVPKMKRRNVRVAELAERLLTKRTTTDYFITFLNADVPGYGEALRSLSLEGEDIAGTGFFLLGEETEPTSTKGGLQYANFNAKRIGLRPVTSRNEFGRFGADNRVEFSDDSIGSLEEFFSFVNV